MHAEGFFAQAFVYLLAAVIAVPVARRLGLGSVLGYLLAGVAIGPFGLHYLAVTNHHRTLAPPIPCWRYDSLVADLNDTSLLTMERAFAIERRVARTEAPYNTVYIAGCIPETREMWLSCSEGGVPASQVEPVHFDWADLFGE